mgnify:FL=1
MKIQKIIALSAFIAVLGFTSCSNGSSSDGDSEADFNSKQALKFDLTNAKAIASVEETSSRNIASRASSSNLNSPLIKILEDSSVASILSIPSNAQGNISEIEKIINTQDKSGNKYLYIVFNGSSWFGYNGEDGEYTNVNLSQLICVYEDGSYKDILGSSNNSYSYIDNENYIQTDSYGCLYFIKRTDNNTSICKYDPVSQKTSNLTAPLEGINYSKFQMSQDGTKIFVSGYRYSYSSSSYGNSAYFIRYIPVQFPEYFKNIYYSSDSYGAYGWVYQDSTDYFYYIQENNKKHGLYRIKINTMEEEHFYKNDFISVDEEPKDNDYYSNDYYLKTELGESVLPSSYNQLYSTSNGIWAQPSNYGSSKYFMKIVDNYGTYVGKTFDSVAPIGLYTYNDAFYFLNAILDSSGNETGVQNIYMFDTNSGKFENLFKKVPVELEIISYSAGNGKLYFSAVKGISLLNGTINLETKEFTRLDTESKLTSIAAY